MPLHAVALIVLLVLTLCGSARADDAPNSYAIVIGANRGGHGQAPLRYATDDARLFAQLVAELGRTDRDRMDVLVEPSIADVTQALAVLRTRLTADARAGKRSKVFFYYSGHAQARALSFGGGELPLDLLRKELLSLPSTLTVAVLDACQSGAFSGVKGAAPAADFSASSVANLNNEGIAVMASSTANELSQESMELGASYFTHHLITALRGAADGDHDGRVSLHEAYAYAYQNTLSDTLRTRVGSQHATLETELKGHGNLPLTYTADADAQLLLSERIAGRVVVQQSERGAVLAELTKGEGASLTLALPHGAYDVLITRAPDEAPLSCPVRLARGALYPLQTRGCKQLEPLLTLAAKGEAAPLERWFVELGVGRRFSQHDAYLDTLSDFRFRDVGDHTLANDSGSFTPTFAGGLGLGPHVALLARLERLQKREFERVFEHENAADEQTDFAWKTWSLALGVRVSWPVWRGRIVPFVEGDLGLGLARTTYTGVSGTEDSIAHAGPVLRADAGVIVPVYRAFGVVLGGGYDFAPVIDNDIGQKRNDGGLHVQLALRLRFLRKGA